MIDIAAWRARIGTFSHPLRAKHDGHSTETSTDDYTLAARLAVISMTLWFLYTEHLLLNHVTRYFEASAT